MENYLFYYNVNMIMIFLIRFVLFSDEYLVSSGGQQLSLPQRNGFIRSSSIHKLCRHRRLLVLSLLQFPLPFRHHGGVFVSLSVLGGRG